MSAHTCSQRPTAYKVHEGTWVVHFVGVHLLRVAVYCSGVCSQVFFSEALGQSNMQHIWQSFKIPDEHLLYVQ